MEWQAQNYLRSGKTLEELTREFAIKVSHYPALGVVMLNYDQIASDMTQAICRECRALILSADFQTVVSRSFPKFFNQGEPNGADIEAKFDWSAFAAQEKRDGTLICLYHWRGAWQIATKGRADASGQVNVHPLTFAELTRRTAAEQCGGWEAFCGALNPDVFYSFELTGLLNRILVAYPVHEMRLLAAWERNTQEEIPVAGLPSPAPLVKTYPIAALADLADYLNRFGPHELEGAVLVDRSGIRLKVKNAAYLLATRALSSIATPRRRLEMLLADQYDDIAPLLPDAARQDVDRLRDLLAAFRETVLTTYAAIENIAEQKDFAQKALPYPYSGLLFQLRRGEEWTALLGKTHPDRLLGWMGVAATAQEEGES